MKIRFLQPKPDERLKNVIFFIEATSYERLCLWRENKPNLEQDYMGYWQIVGFIDKKGKMPVCVCFTFAKLYGQQICFYESTSRYIDNTMIEEWLDGNFPIKYDGNSRKARTDAMNFGHAVVHCKSLKNEKELQASSL